MLDDCDRNNLEALNYSINTHRSFGIYQSLGKAHGYMKRKTLCVYLSLSSELTIQGGGRCMNKTLKCNAVLY